MDEVVQHNYLRELEFQCQLALQAKQDLSSFFVAWAENDLKGEAELELDPLFARREIFRHSHSFLTHSANISKLFWPMKDRNPKKDRVAQERAVHLKTLLAISDDNPLRDRAVRNHLDHYDERLDEWATKTEGVDIKVLVVDAIGRYGGLVGGPLVDQEIVQLGEMRWLDPETTKLHFRGESVDFRVVIDAIEKILQKLEPLL